MKTLAEALAAENRLLEHADPESIRAFVRDAESLLKELEVEGAPADRRRLRSSLDRWRSQVPEEKNGDPRMEDELAYSDRSLEVDGGLLIDHVFLDRGGRLVGVVRPPNASEETLGRLIRSYGYLRDNAPILYEHLSRRRDLPSEVKLIALLGKASAELAAVLRSAGLAGIEVMLVRGIKTAGGEQEYVLPAAGRIDGDAQHPAPGLERIVEHLLPPATTLESALIPAQPPGPGRVTGVRAVKGPTVTQENA